MLCEKFIGTVNRFMGVGEVLRRVLECLVSGIVMLGGVLCVVSYRYRIGFEVLRSFFGGFFDWVRVVVILCFFRVEVCDYFFVLLYLVLCRFRSVI